MSNKFGIYVYAKAILSVSRLMKNNLFRVPLLQIHPSDWLRYDSSDSVYIIRYAYIDCRLILVKLVLVSVDYLLGYAVS